MVTKHSKQTLVWGPIQCEFEYICGAGVVCMIHKLMLALAISISNSQFNVR